ncbi:hypothetical protein OCS_04031 [Ophiocordyceps sinensis CO18]|uniref:Uncharacterized protein n=1 Tax=Ophiocordyceps sinensis (strain Co18 / CGMCC 3.14243) TaxID=911162 RepID=T5A471_OPHSC|nr:hypothetical protein OCS_04031 [Ophiocordyceps sinensis CO18]
MIVHLCVLVLLAWADGARPPQQRTPGLRKGSTSRALKFKAQIERSVKVKDMAQAYVMTGEKFQKPCRNDYIDDEESKEKCREVHYYTRNMLSSRQLKITAWPEVNIEQHVQTGERQQTMQLQGSTEILDSIPQGWNIALNGTVGRLGEVKGSAYYRKKGKSTLRRTVTRGRRKAFTCPPWHRCYLETWTWHVRVSGTCQRLPRLFCGKEVQVCYSEEDLVCPAYKRFFHEVCDESLENKMLCNVTLPLFYVNKAAETSFMAAKTQRGSEDTRCRAEKTETGSEDTRCRAEKTETGSEDTR